MTTVSVTRRGVRGESAADVARRVGSFMGIEVASDDTDEEILDAANVGGLLSLTETRTAYFGREGEPVDSAAQTGDATLVFDQVVPSNGVVTEIKLFGGSSGGTCKLKRFTRAGNVFTLVAEHSFNVTANTLATSAPVDFEVEAGDYLGVYGPTNALGYTATDTDNPAWYFSSGDVTTNFTDSDGASPGARIEARIIVEHIVPTEAALKTAQATEEADGFDHIMREFLDANGEVAAEFGFQNVDDQDPQGFFVRGYSGDRATWFELTSYQFGFALRGHGENGETCELQLASDDDENLAVEFSVRHRDGDAGGTKPNRGARMQVRNAADTVGFWMSIQTATRAEIALEDHASTPAAITYDHPKATGRHDFEIGGTVRTIIGPNYIQQRETNADPADPAEGHMRIWLSDGTGAGDDGDVMVKITAGGVTKTATLIDFSAV